MQTTAPNIKTGPSENIIEIADKAIIKQRKRENGKRIKGNSEIAQPTQSKTTEIKLKSCWFIQNNNLYFYF
jgi:hypothetical protein